MDNVMISVIIPVYNGEAFVERSIKSVLNQTSSEIELIIVNDGSRDRSGAIADSFAAERAHVHVVHKPNGGISSARNAGIKEANGEYLCFLDADDYLDENACAEMIKVIREYEPDCMDFGYRYISTSGIIASNRHKVEKNRLLSKAEIREIILPPLLNLRKDDDHFIYDFSCTKLFKREIIQKHQICFDESRRIWEDRPFVLWYLKYCNSFYSMEQCFYNYVDVPGSLSRRYSLQFFDIILDNYRLYREWYGDEFDFDTPYANAYWAGAIERMIIRSLEERESISEIKENILRILKEPQVIDWFSKRVPETHDKMKINCYVSEGKAEKVYRIFVSRKGAQGFCRMITRALRKLKRALIEWFFI